MFFEKTLKGFLIGTLSFGLFGGLVGKLNLGVFLNLDRGTEIMFDWLGGGLYDPLGLALLFGLIFGTFGGLIYGNIGGFTDKLCKDRALPNQGILLTFKNGVLTGFTAMTICALFTGLIGWKLGYLRILIIESMVDLLIVGLMVGLNRGLGAVIKHYTLRLVLWSSGITPFKFIPFLDYSAKLILLKKVGGGYIFIHRMLLEYFAKLGTTDSK